MSQSPREARGALCNVDADGGIGSLVTFHLFDGGEVLFDGLLDEAGVHLLHLVAYGRQFLVEQQPLDVALVDEVGVGAVLHFHIHSQTRFIVGFLEKWMAAKTV